MSFNIEVTTKFSRQIKRLTKKFSSLKNEYAQLIESLEEDPTQGTLIQNNCYKIRLAIASKGKGKSGGARVITHIQVVRNVVYLLDIYDKSEKNTISDKEIKELIKDL